VQKFYVCNNKKCNAVLETRIDDLPKRHQSCGHVYKKSQGSCSILILLIEKQIRWFLESGGMNEKKTNRFSFDGTTRGDIQSGACYIEKIKQKSKNERIISLQLNVDGAQCFKSSKYGFWPYMGVINEAAYGSRRSNMLLLALWYGNKKPPKEAFLDSSLKEMQRLAAFGIQFDGIKYTIKPIVLTTDTMARSIFLNCIQFNGKFGCDFCLHKGMRDI